MEMFFTRIKNLYHTMQGENTWSEVVDMHSYRWGTTTDIYRLSYLNRNRLPNAGQRIACDPKLPWIQSWTITADSQPHDVEQMTWFWLWKTIVFFLYTIYFDIFLIYWLLHWQVNKSCKLLILRIEWHSINFNNIFQDSSISITSCKFIQGLWSQ